jgi:hypothetical protein
MPLNLPVEVWLMLAGAAALFLTAIVFIVLMRGLLNRARGQ